MQDLSDLIYKYEFDTGFNGVGDVLIDIGFGSGWYY